MKNYIVILALTTVLWGCDTKDTLSSVNANIDNNTVWTFTQFNVLEEDDKINSYYYYGEISSTLYQKISDNQLATGFILLRNVKYWGDDDLIYNYRPIETNGNLIFRIEDIQKMELVRTEPISGKGLEQFEEVETEETAKKDTVNTESDAAIKESADTTVAPVEAETETEKPTANE